MPMHIADIPWNNTGATVRPIALRGAVVVGIDADHRFYVGLWSGPAITTTAGPVTANEALDLVLDSDTRTAAREDA